MIDLILSFLGKALYPILAGAGALLFILFQRWNSKRKDRIIENQDAVIKVHEAKEEVHKQDDVTDQETDMRVDELRKKVEDAETPEKGAWDIQEAINRYFEGRDK